MGMFITVEGGEYTGKTSLVVPALESILKEVGVPTLTGRLPGGTHKGEIIREEALRRTEQGAPAEEVAILFNKTHRLLLDEKVYPFLNENENGAVLLDRYIDSTVVYQGLEGRVSTETLFSLISEYNDNFYPDLTLLLQFPEHVFEKTLRMRKLHAREDEGRSSTVWDRESASKHLERQRKYLSLPEFYRQHDLVRNFKVIDASGSPFFVVEQLVDAVSSVAEREYGQEIRSELKGAYRALQKEGRWDEFDESWHEQLALERMRNEGRMRGKEF